MTRLLLHLGLPHSSAILLTEAVWDVIHVADIGMSRSDDGEILRRAGAVARVCVTLDADFHALLMTGGERGPSVVRIRKEGLDAAVLAALLQGIWGRIEDAPAQPPVAIPRPRIPDPAPCPKAVRHR